MYPDINFFPVLARYFNVSIDCLFGFSNELTEEEYADFKKECTELFAQREYSVGMEKIKALCFLFPTNDKMKIDLITNSIPYLALCDDMQMRNRVAHQMIVLCQNCIDESIQCQKHFILAHLFMLTGQENKLTTNHIKETKNFMTVDMTNSFLLRADGNAEEKIEAAILSLGIQLIYELRNKSSYLQKRNDLQGALTVAKKQIMLAELLELDASVYFMLYMNISYLYCLLGDAKNAEKTVEMFVKLFREKPITDNVIFQVYKAGFSSNQFDLIRDTSIFKNLENLFD